MIIKPNQRWKFKSSCGTVGVLEIVRVNKLSCTAIVLQLFCSFGWEEFPLNKMEEWNYPDEPSKDDEVHGSWTYLRGQDAC